MLFKRKRLFIAIGILVMFVLYALAMDPDTKLLENLPYGAGLLISLQVVLMTALGIAVIEIVTDFFTDAYFKVFDSKESIEEIKSSPVAMAIYMVGWGIRILAYSIVVAASIIAYVGG